MIPRVAPAGVSTIAESAAQIGVRSPRLESIRPTSASDIVAESPVALYVGYYESQRTGDTIHSPQNCLPGAGWLPVRTSRIDLRVPGREEPVTVNSLLIQKGLERQVVLYWYQSHGRVVASDYLSKAYLVYDAARHRRSDAAMVRVISPVGPSDTSDRETEARAARFIQAMFPDLERLLPT